MKSKAAARIRAYLTDDRWRAGIILIFYAVGVAGHALLPGWMRVLTPYVLWIFGLLVAAIAWRGAKLAEVGEEGSAAARRRFLLWGLLTYVVTFTLEAIGTATGAIFGPYTYGTVLGFRLFAVPLVIGFNWVLVVIGSLRLFRRLPTILFVPAVGLAAVVFDLLLEPVAIRWGYWTWHAPTIPIRNYVAWFIIASLAAAAWRITRLQIRSWLPTYYLAIQTLFFAALLLVV